jgi:hypothetical protein
VPEEKPGAGGRLAVLGQPQALPDVAQQEKLRLHLTVDVLGDENPQRIVQRKCSTIERHVMVRAEGDAVLRGGASGISQIPSFCNLQNG